MERQRLNLRKRIVLLQVLSRTPFATSYASDCISLHDAKRCAYQFFKLSKAEGELGADVRNGHVAVRNFLADPLLENPANILPVYVYVSEIQIFTHRFFAKFYVKQTTLL